MGSLGTRLRWTALIASLAACLFPDTSGLGGSPSDAGDAATDAGADYRATVLADGPLAYWRLDDATGAAVAKDETGNGHDGTVVGQVTFGVPGALASGDTCAQFADNALISVGNVFGFVEAGAFSIELWLNPLPADDGWRPVLSKGDYQAYQGGYAVLTNGPGADASATTTLDFLTETSPDGGKDENDYGEPITTGRWTYYVVAFDGTTNVTLYVNGTPIQTTPVNPLWTASTVPFTLGGPSDVHGGGTYHGAIDEVAVYGQALSSVSVKRHYDVGMGL